MATVIRRFADTTATPWRNGLGRMWMLVDESHATDLTARHKWRLSLARLDGPAPFSTFAGLHRTLVPLGGSIRLEINGRQHDVPDATTVRFAGTANARLVALDRPCYAVNLMSSDPLPTLAVAAKGSQLDVPTVAMMTASTDATARFDVVLLEPGEILQADALVIDIMRTTPPTAARQVRFGEHPPYSPASATTQ